MNILLILGIIFLPLLMVYLHDKWNRSCTVLILFMILSLIIFGSIAAISIHEIIKNDRVFMTAIHAVFLNPLFLITGAYIMIFPIYRLILLCKEEW